MTTISLDRLPLDYRIVPTREGFCLQYREPARRTWQDVAYRPSVDDCVRAFERMRDTGTVRQS